MQRLPISSALAISLLCSSALLKAGPQEPNQTPPAPVPSLTTYQDPPDGLKKFAGEIIGAMESKDSIRASALFSTLEIPDHGAWFVKMFGPAEGPRLDAKYAEMLPEEAGRIKGCFQHALAGGKTDVELGVVAFPSSGPGHAIVEAMVQPFLIFSVSGRNPKEKSSELIGYFVDAGDGFRSIDESVFQALSTASSLHIPPFHYVERGKLIHQVAPIYPHEAKAKHIEGEVVLRGIIGKDGKLEGITPVGGEPLLIQSAVKAARQWEYQPTLFDGAPVDVNTTITVQFNLR